MIQFITAVLLKWADHLRVEMQINLKLSGVEFYSIVRRAQNDVKHDLV